MGLYEVSLLILFFLVLFFYRPYFDEGLFNYLKYLIMCSENNEVGGALEEGKDEG